MKCILGSKGLNCDSRWWGTEAVKEGREVTKERSSGVAEACWGCVGRYTRRWCLPIPKAEKETTMSFFPRQSQFFPFLNKPLEISAFSCDKEMNVLLKHFIEFEDLREWEGCMAFGKAVSAVAWVDPRNTRAIALPVSLQCNIQLGSKGFISTRTELPSGRCFFLYGPGHCDAPFLLRLILHLIMICFHWV